MTHTEIHLPKLILLPWAAFSSVKFSSVTQSCPTPCDPMDFSPAGSTVHGILQARILEWVAFQSPGDLPDPGIKSMSLGIAGRFLTISATRAYSSLYSLKSDLLNS